MALLTSTQLRKLRFGWTRQLVNRLRMDQRVKLLDDNGRYTGHEYGSAFFVDSTLASASNNNSGLSWDKALATIDAAVGKCTASKNDTIYVAPGHSEAISSATGLVIDVAGVRIVGMGSGSLRPLLTLDTAGTATVSITAANVTIENIRMLSNFTTGIDAGITAAATADGLTLLDIEMNETANTKEWLVGIAIAAACNDVTISGLRFHGIAGGSSADCIEVIGASNNLRLLDSYIHGDFSASIVDATAAASTDVEVARNAVINIDTAAGLGIDFHDSSTGFVHDNRVTNLRNGVEGVTGDGLAYAENYCSNALNVQGLLIPVADS